MIVRHSCQRHRYPQPNLLSVKLLYRQPCSMHFPFFRQATTAALSELTPSGHSPSGDRLTTDRAPRKLVFGAPPAVSPQPPVQASEALPFSGPRFPTRGYFLASSGPEEPALRRR